MISGKLRGSVQNFGLNCNYFSKTVDCGLISNKSRGSLTKEPGRTITFRSGPSDPDRVARIKGGAVLIRAARSGSNGSGRLGAGMRRRRHRENFSVVALRGCSSAFSNSATRGSIRLGFGSGVMRAALRTLLRAQHRGAARRSGQQRRSRA